MLGKRTIHTARFDEASNLKLAVCRGLNGLHFGSLIQPVVSLWLWCSGLGHLAKKRACGFHHDEGYIRFRATTSKEV